MAIIHIVLFQFKVTASPEAVQNVGKAYLLSSKQIGGYAPFCPKMFLSNPNNGSKACTQVLALKDDCLHPRTHKPYIKSFIGGKDHSPENAQHGMTHGFVAEFESLEDRDYYVSEDPIHLALGKRIGPLVEKFQCVDFTNGILM